MRSIAPSSPPAAAPGARAAPPRRPAAARRATAAAARKPKPAAPAEGQQYVPPPPPTAEDEAAREAAARDAYLAKLKERASTGAMYRKIRPKYDMSADIQAELQQVFLGVNTIEEVETEEDELTKQLASFSAYQRSLGLAAAEVKDPEPAPAKGIWQAFNPWDFNALPSVETSLAELKAGGVLDEEQCESFRNRRFVRYQKDYILTRGEIVAMAKAIYDNGNFHSFDRDYEMRKFIHNFKCMYRSIYDIKRIIDMRMDIREAQVNEILLKRPQKVPCPIQLAVADAALVVEFELDLQLHMMVLSMREGEKTSEAFEALVEKQEKAWLSATVQALRDGLDMPQLAALGLRRTHLEAASEQVALPFPLESYDAFLADYLKPPSKWELLDGWLEGVQPATGRVSAFRDRDPMPDPDAFTFIDGYKGGFQYDEEEQYRRAAYPTDGGTWAEPPESDAPPKDYKSKSK